MKKFMDKHGTALFMAAVLVAFSIPLMMLSGCAAINDWLVTLKGELVGNDYIINQYDNFGQHVFTVRGDKITLDGEVDNYGELTSYIDITIDGYEWQHVGGTLVFAQNGVDIITDFQVPTDITTSAGTSSGLMAVDRFINNYRNLFGKQSVIIVSSQTGTPVCLLQGDSVYTEIPADLPKTTKLNIDGKAVYIHRANVDIMPAAMFTSN